MEQPTYQVADHVQVKSGKWVGHTGDVARVSKNGHLHVRLDRLGWYLPFEPSEVRTKAA